MCFADFFCVNFTAVSGELGIKIRKLHDLQMREKRFCREQKCRSFFKGHRFECFKRISIFQSEATCFRSDERGHSPTATELLPDVGAKRADVSTFGAKNAHGIVFAFAVDFEFMDGDGSCFSFDGDAASGKVDEFFAAYFQGAIHRRDLHDRSGEFFCCFKDGLLFGDICAFGENASCDIFRVGRNAEAKTCDIFLIFFR